MVKRTQESVSTYHQFLGNINDAVLLVDAGTRRIIDANKLALALLGRSREEILGRKQIEIHPYHMSNKICRVGRSNLKRGYGIGYYHEVIRKDGTTVPVTIIASTMVVDGRRLILNILRNVKKYEQIAKLLLKNEEKYRVLCEQSMDGICVTTRYGECLHTNQAAAKIVGRTKEELFAMNAIEVYEDSNERSKFQQVLEKDGFIRDYEIKQIKKDGTRVDCVMNSDLLYDDNGDILGYHSVVRDITKRKRFDDNTKYYIVQITKAQEEERRRIARDLHDETVQSLVSLYHDIHCMMRQNSLPGKIVEKLKRLCKKCNSIVSELRQFSQELRPDILDRLGLISALEVLANDLTNRSMPKTHLHVIGSERRLTSETEIGLYRIAQEALRNVWKHAKATEAVVRVQFGMDIVNLTITDNGQGFKLPRQLHEFALKGRLGLVGMQERARLINGVLKVDSQLGRGTTVLVSVKTEVKRQQVQFDKLSIKAE